MRRPFRTPLAVAAAVTLGYAAWAGWYVHHHPVRHPGDGIPLLHVHPVPDLADRRDRGHLARHTLGADRLLHVHPGDGGPEHVIDQHDPFPIQLLAGR